MPRDRTQNASEAEFTSSAAFGPSFFIGPLRAFARECCPSASEGLPSVSLQLATGEALELCHVAGLASEFVALAVFHERSNASGTTPAMRTELVPYALITRVTIQPHRDSGPRVGFDLRHEPQVISKGSPEEMLRAVSREPPPDATAEAVEARQCSDDDAEPTTSNAVPDQPCAGG